MRDDIRQRAYLNEYLYIDFIYLDGKVKVLYDRGVPKKVYKFVDVGSRIILKCCDKELGEIDKDTGYYERYSTTVTTSEIRNYNSYFNSKDAKKKKIYKKNLITFRRRNIKDIPYPLELHTHFMEVLSDEEFLEVIKSLEYIPVDKNGEICFCDIDVQGEPTTIFKTGNQAGVSNISKQDITWISAKEALTRPEVFEQLRIPVGKQVTFDDLHPALMKRNSLINLLSYQIAQKQMGEAITDKKLFNEKQEKAKYAIYYKLLVKSLEVLNEQGVKYVEFSYSNIKTIQEMINMARERNLKVGDIQYKFLLSGQRNKGGRAFRKNMKNLTKYIEDYPEIIGFDLMGPEQEIIMENEERTLTQNGDLSCDNLYTKLEFVVKKLLNCKGLMPTLRLHSGEIFYHREGAVNSNPYQILLLLKRVEQQIRIESNNPHFKLADYINIRIGHGLHFEDSREYYNLLKHFNVIVEICESSNFALGNITNLEEMPYDKYIRNKIPFVIATDGGGFYLTTLKDEARQAAFHNVKEVLKRIKKTRSRFKIKMKNVSQFINEEIFDTSLNDREDGTKGLSINIDELQRITGKNIGLNLNYTVEDYAREHNMSEDIVQFKNDEEERLFLYNYILSSNSFKPEILEKELVSTQAAYHDYVINETYFSNEEERLIARTFKRIKKCLKDQNYLDAAILLASLQVVMGNSTKLEDAVNLMRIYGLEFNECLTGDKIVLSKKRIEKNKDYELVSDTDKKLYKYIFDYSNIEDIKYLDVLEYYLSKNDYRLDNPEKKYYNNKDSEMFKVANELKDVLKIINREKNDNQDMLMEKVNMAFDYLENGEVLKAAVGVVCLQEYLGVKVKLEVAQLYMRAIDYTLEDFFNSNEIDLEKGKGGKKL